MEVVDMCMLSNSHQGNFQKKTRQHVRIVHRADFFVRLYLTNKLPNLASNLSQCCIFQSTCITDEKFVCCCHA